MCGWRRDVEDIILVLDSQVLRGSTLHILCALPVDERERRWREGGFSVDQLKNLRVVHHVGNAGARRTLDELPILTYDSVLILADQTRETQTLDSDAANLATLLLIRDLRYEGLARHAAADAPGAPGFGGARGAGAASPSPMSASAACSASAARGCACRRARRDFASTPGGGAPTRRRPRAAGRVQ